MVEGLGPKYKYYSNLQEGDVQIKLHRVTLLAQSRSCAIKKHRQLHNKMDDNVHEEYLKNHFR